MLAGALTLNLGTNAEPPFPSESGPRTWTKGPPYPGRATASCQGSRGQPRSSNCNLQAAWPRWPSWHQTQAHLIWKKQTWDGGELLPGATRNKWEEGDTWRNTSSKEKQPLGLSSLDSAPTRWALRWLGLRGATPYCSVTLPVSIRTPSISSNWPRSVVGKATENFFPLQAEGHTRISLPGHAWSCIPQPASLQWPRGYSPSTKFPRIPAEHQVPDNKSHRQGRQ